MGGIEILSFLVLVAAIYFISAAIFMLLYNYSVPVIAGSINANYDKKRTFKKIQYLQACVLILFISMIFGSSTIVVNRCL